MAQKFKNWIVCSPIDADYLKEQLPSDVAVSVISNGVDTEYFTPVTSSPEPDTLLVSGLFTKFVNIEAARYFVRDVFPLLRTARPELMLYLVGPASATVRKLAGPNVIVTGEVPDLRHYVARASVICVPVLTGAGTRNKILQAWSIGRPVVSTPQGLEGLAGKDERDLLVATTPQDFAEKILRLLTDAVLYQRLVANGQKIIISTYAMMVINQSLERLLKRSL